jgi:hypothetical protein
VVQVIVLVSIGNSDDKLSQEDWSEFIASVRSAIHSVRPKVQIHGEWFSAPDVQWQNANWLLEIPGDDLAQGLRDDLVHERKRYDQDSIAWSVVEKTEFI